MTYATVARIEVRFVANDGGAWGMFRTRVNARWAATTEMVSV